MERRGLCSVDPRHAVERSLQAMKRADAEKDEKGADLPGLEASTAVGTIWYGMPVVSRPALSSRTLRVYGIFFMTKSRFEAALVVLSRGCRRGETRE